MMCSEAFSRMPSCCCSTDALIGGMELRKERPVLAQAKRGDSQPGPRLREGV